MKKMLNGNILVNEVKVEDSKTESGLFLAPEPKAYILVDVVQSDSEGVVEDGDRLVVPINSGTPLEVDGVKYFVVNVRDIILVV